MYVKLKVSKVINHKKYNIGDWVDVGTGDAAKWIAAELAEALDISALLNTEGIGIIHPPAAKKAIPPIKRIPVLESGKKPHFQRNLFLNASYAFSDRDSPDLLRNIGRLALFFDLLNTWDVLLIIASFEMNASKVAPDEAEITREIVHDLRVPYYQNCAIGVRDSAAGNLFCEAWEEESLRGRVLAPLRALYKVKPMAYYLPCGWGKITDKVAKR